MIKDKSKLFEYLLLVFIVLVGSILRFWDYGNIPFMHDELSALSRLQFDNFQDLIREGVMLGDNHPAGVQVFLYYWTYLFGTSEVIVKLPFVISGILSIYISYLVGKLWFNSTTGILTATFIASLQFFVMYSQIARPYISGLLITLLMVYMWSLYFFTSKKRIYLLLFVLFAVLAFYNHYFSLLFTVIVSISGLFLIKRKDLILYSISGLLILIFYIPHFDIFFTQLSRGDIGGWLSKPTLAFHFQYLNWIFHFSLWSWLALCIVVLYMILEYKDFKDTTRKKQKRWLLIIWFLTPIVIGYMYSVLRSPIIQYSLLIFSTPYLFILLFSFYKRISILKLSIIVVGLLLINISTLVFSRNYYKIFYKQPYEETFKTVLLTYDANDVFMIDNCIPYFHEYYFNKYERSIPYFTKRNTNIGLDGFEEIVSNITESKVITHALTGEQLQIIQSYFPYQLGYANGFTYEIYTFSKYNPADGNVIRRDLIAQTDFNNEIGNWKDIQNLVEHDSPTDRSICRMSTNDEWGPFISFSLDSIVRNGLGIIDVEIEMMMPDTINKALIVANIIEGKESIYWKAINLESYNPEIGKWRKVFLSVDIQGALKSRNDMSGLVLTIYIWNPIKIELLIKNINIYRKPGNPLRYSLYY